MTSSARLRAPKPPRTVIGPFAPHELLDIKSHFRPGQGPTVLKPYKTGNWAAIVAVLRHNRAHPLDQRYIEASWVRNPHQGMRERLRRQVQADRIHAKTA